MTSRFWLFGILTGAAVATAIALIVTIWEWVENPGGIFHNAEGTNWHFVYDTAVSWFFPIFGWVTVIAALIHLAWSRLRTVWQHRRARGDDVD